jgi:hypothetical protein
MDVEPPPTTSLDNEWCTVNEAARRLGVTATAIRNRIKRGTLDTRPNGNFGRLVRVPPTVTLTPKEPVPRTVPLTADERVILRMTLTVLAGHVDTLKNALAKAEAATERLGQERDEARRGLLAAQAEAAYVPALRTTVEVRKQALATEKGRSAELRAARDRLAARRWWQWRAG